MTSGWVSRLVLIAALAPATAFAAAPSYTISTSVALGAPDRWDYVSFDPQTRHVYVSHGDRVTVVDGVSGKIIGDVANQPGSHGAAVADDLGRGIVDSAANKEATLFDSATLKPLGTAPAGDDADGITYDKGTGRAFIANGDAGTVTAIDMKAGTLAGTVTLGSKPEALVADGAGHVYVNGESTREVLRIDASTLFVTARFPIPDCESPHGIAMDAETQRIFTSCINSKLFVLDANSGNILASFDIGKGSDTVSFDPKAKLAFSSNGDGTLSVIAEKSADAFALLGNVPTMRGARTMAVDPENGRVFLVTADIDHVDPPKTPGGRVRAVYKPGTLKLYFLDPAR
jgi:DNA-binding beta-propeller fold protein YncE